MAALKLLLLLSLAPPLLLAHIMHKRDILDAEPKKLLRKTFLFGCLSVVAAVILETVGEAVFFVDGGARSSFFALVFDNFIVIGLTEEFCKFMAAYLCSWKNKNFNCFYDGILYCMVSALGFAAVENVMYVFGSYSAGVAVLRALTSIPMHCCFGMISGYFYSRARERKNDGGEAFGLILTGLLISAALHGAFDFCITASDLILGGAGWLISILIAIVGIIWMFAKTKKWSQKDYFIAPRVEEETAQPRPQSYDRNPYGSGPNSGSQWQP